MKKHGKVNSSTLNNNFKTGGKMNLKPFLYLPFKKQKYQISEGWNYSEEEKKIHSFLGHGGIDFALPKGTEIYAVADGIAIASYYSYKLNKKYKGKEIWFGLGYFVQIYHPQYKMFITYAHFSEIDPAIKFHKPKKRNNYFWPVGHKVLPEKLEQYKFASKVKKGQLIGYSGNSGLGWGKCDYSQKSNSSKFISWDEPHLHFEIFVRQGSKRKKKYFDPCGIKNQSVYYPDSFRIQNRGNMGKEGNILWLIGKDGMPQFIK